MYNRYIPSGTGYVRVSEPMPQDPPQKQPPPRTNPPHEEQNSHIPHRDPISSLLSGLTGKKKNAGISGILDAFKLNDLDTGDILLLLILLFLFREGDDLELVITLGLILLLGLGDKEPHGEA